MGPNESTTISQTSLRLSVFLQIPNLVTMEIRGYADECLSALCVCVCVCVIDKDGKGECVVNLCV